MLKKSSTYFTALILGQPPIMTTEQCVVAEFELGG